MDAKIPEPLAVVPGDLAALSDDQLVERFRSERSPELCALIGARHGQMIFRTCVRRLANVHDAEDATQAVFLTFVQRPERVKGPLGAWLYGVARQTVHNMLRAKARRQRREEANVQAKTVDAQTTLDLREELDAALERLPARLRGAIVARYLEGQSVAASAESAGCDPGTFGRRCAQGLERLRSILARRGTVVTSAVLVSFMSQEALAAAPATLAGTLKAVMTGTAAASAPAALLSKQVVSAMFWGKAKLVAAVATSALATAGAAGVVVPLLLPASSPATSARTAEKAVLLRLDFEDGSLPALCTAGKVVKGPDHPGNRFCLEGPLLMERKEGLFSHSDELVLTFDVWVDRRVSTLELHYWNQTQRGSFGVAPLPIAPEQREQWLQGVIVRFADFRFGAAVPKPGDLIANLSLKAGQPDGTIYVDNLECARVPDPGSLQQKK